jgi:dynein heavy chain
MIDPQNQANKWIRNLEMDNSLSIVRFSTPNYLKILEHAITNGNPVIIN